MLESSQKIASLADYFPWRKILILRPCYEHFASTTFASEPVPPKCFSLRMMVRDRMQSGERFWKSGVVTTFLILTPFLCNGCANPGPPKPPSLYLPQLVNDLSAERVGDHVLLRWTTPSRTTDEMEINGAMSAEVCRDADARPASAHAKLATCTPVRRVQVTSGQSEMTDTLPVAPSGGSRDAAELPDTDLQLERPFGGRIRGSRFCSVRTGTGTDRRPAGEGERARRRSRMAPRGLC